MSFHSVSINVPILETLNKWRYPELLPNFMSTLFDSACVSKLHLCQVKHQVSEFLTIFMINIIILYDIIPPLFIHLLIDIYIISAVLGIANLLQEHHNSLPQSPVVSNFCDQDCSTLGSSCLSSPTTRLLLKLCPWSW